MYCYDYPRAAITTDVVTFTLFEDQLKLLLIRRAHAPYQGRWALPGGFIEMEEDLEQAAHRELQEETGITGLHLYQLRTFGKPGRDPRGRVITVAYYSLVNSARLKPRAASDAAEVGWFALDKLPQLAFDHAKIIAMAHQHLRRDVSNTDLVLLCLPAEFTLTELQSAYECITGKQQDKRNFRKWLMSRGWVEESGGERRGKACRPARLYRRKRVI